MARVTVPAQLLIDRYYRGARLLLGTRSFVVPEPAVRLLEAAAREGSYELRHDTELALARELIDAGLLLLERRPPT